MVSNVKDTVTVATPAAMVQQDVEPRQLVRYFIIRVHVKKNYICMLEFIIDINTFLTKH